VRVVCAAAGLVTDSPARDSGARHMTNACGDAMEATIIVGWGAMANANLAAKKYVREPELVSNFVV